MKATGSYWTPSLLYNSSSSLNVCWLKCCCNFSLQKLMHNCSKELFSNISKPKMSNTPMKCPLSPLIASFTRNTNQSNNFPYTAFANASVPSRASAGANGITLRSPLTSMLRVTKHWDKSLLLTPKNSAATSTTWLLLMELSSLLPFPVFRSKLMFPNVKIPVVK